MENQILAVKDLIPTTPWGEILKELLRSYPWIIEEEEQEYKEVFNKLHFIVAKPSDLVLIIKIFFDQGERRADAAAYNDECPGGYSMMATPWGEVLGYTIAAETLEQLSHAEILAHCLYDMTWFGSSEIKIEENCEQIRGG